MIAASGSLRAAGIMDRGLYVYARRSRPGGPAARRRLLDKGGVYTLLER